MKTRLLKKARERVHAVNSSGVYWIIVDGIYIQTTPDKIKEDYCHWVLDTAKQISGISEDRK